ncbi:unnamed protein product [Ambrosiozyma monospora]|uniref:Unnamed protein product n=1 Tax=Ambrosiozyma monospora TaxID=43982 RepID=A0ACB5TRR3_AMBMO|nr:unnamed protein product [Ambrosiozyma monospora]
MRWCVRDDGSNEVVIRNLAHELKKHTSELEKKDVVFEKIMGGVPEGEQQQQGENDDQRPEPELEFVNLLDIEALAEEAYRTQ